MVSTYSEFVNHVVAMSWMTGSTDFVNKLPNYIQMADAKLNRVLDIDRRNVTVVASVTAENYTGITNIRQVQSITHTGSTQGGVFNNTLRSHIDELRAQTSSQRLLPFYAFDNGTIMFVGPMSVADPVEFTIRYRSNVPSLQTLDESWLVDDYLDMYTWTVLEMTAIARREDQALIAEYSQQADEAIGAAIREDKEQRAFGGSPTFFQSHHPVPPTRRMK